jgi:hypothetical protein
MYEAKHSTQHGAANTASRDQYHHRRVCTQSTACAYHHAAPPTYIVPSTFKAAAK